MITTTEQIDKQKYGCYGHCCNCGQDTDGSYYTSGVRVCRKCWYAAQYDLADERDTPFCGAYAIVWGLVAWVTIIGVGYGMYAMYS